MLDELIEEFERKIKKKVVAYAKNGSSYIFITKSEDGIIDSNYYEVTETSIEITNPILCNLSQRKVVKL